MEAVHSSILTFFLVMYAYIVTYGSLFAQMIEMNVERRC